MTDRWRPPPWRSCPAVECRPGPHFTMMLGSSETCHQKPNRMFDLVCDFSLFLFTYFNPCWNLNVNFGQNVLDDIIHLICFTVQIKRCIETCVNISIPHQVGDWVDSLERWNLLFLRMSEPSVVSQHFTLDSWLWTTCQEKEIKGQRLEILLVFSWGGKWACVYTILAGHCQVFSIIVAKSYVVLGVFFDHILYITEACNLYS